MVSNAKVDRVVAGNGGRIAERDWLAHHGINVNGKARGCEEFGEF